MSNTITITHEATASAQGKLSGARCKPVLCIDTGEIFSSVFDAAEHYGLTPSSLSMACNGKLKTSGGKRFCFISRTHEHIDDIVERIKANDELLAKAAAYDAMIADFRERKEAIEAAEAEMEEQQRLYFEHIRLAGEAQAKFEEAKQLLATLKKESVA